MVLVVDDFLFEVFWAKELHRILRCLLHDLSNCLTGNLAMSELFCIKESEAISLANREVFRDNCYRERDVLACLSNLQHEKWGENYIDLKAFLKQLVPIFNSILPSDNPLQLIIESADDGVIKGEAVYLQRVFLALILELSEYLRTVGQRNVVLSLKNVSGFRVIHFVVNDEGGFGERISKKIFCRLASEIEANTEVRGPMILHFLQKTHGVVEMNTEGDVFSRIVLKFPLVR